MELDVIIIEGERVIESAIRRLLPTLGLHRGEDDFVYVGSFEIEKMDAIVERCRSIGQPIVIRGHPFFDSDGIPSNRVIAWFIEHKLRIIATVCLTGSQLFSRRYQPSPKNVGRVIMLGQGAMGDHRRIRFKDEPVPMRRRHTLVAVDGIIGAGKSTFIQKTIRSGEIMIHRDQTSESKSSPLICFSEPLMGIYEVIHGEMSGEVKQEMIGKIVRDYEQRLLSMLAPSDHPETILIERNWYYSSWLFDRIKGEYPVVDPVIVEMIEKSACFFSHAVFIDTPVDVSIERAEKRGEEDGVSRESQEKLRERLRLLYHPPMYEWAFSRSESAK